MSPRRTTFGEADARKRECTSTEVAPPTPQGLSVLGPDLDGLLATEAHSLLLAAASEIPVEPERMRAFARECLEVTDVGRLDLTVLDGGVFAPRRALELAKLVHDAAAVTSGERVRPTAGT